MSAMRTKPTLCFPTSLMQHLLAFEAGIWCNLAQITEAAI
jgi:hypothetical protein